MDNIIPTKEQCLDAISTTIQQLLEDHPEYIEEDMTCKDFLECLFYIRNTYRSTNKTRKRFIEAKLNLVIHLPSWLC